MRKKILSIAIVLPLLLVLSAVSMSFTQSVSLRGQDAVQAIEQFARDQDMAQAQQALSTLCADWERVEPLLQVWVCHQDTDEVTRHLRGAQVGLVTGDASLLFEHTAALTEALEHLHHRDDLTLSNLL